MNLDQIIEEVNKDIDDTLESEVIIGWVNRCIDELSHITKKEDKKIADIAPENAYQLPDDYTDMVLLLVNGQQYDPVPIRNTISTGYKLWGNVLSLQNAPDSGQLELYYHRRLNHVETESDVPEIESSFHDLLILFTVAHNRFMEDEPGQETDAMSRYERRKREYQDFIMQSSYSYQQQQITDLWS
jgi:hypothetical protein